ncbi:MAG TPA: FMN-dependent NADH-azoreductase [Acidobacteriaceae bacterium]|jgi:FMN-dependent NADH-azoreductase|nr:FMN-dependent NADH-azoreductase [Acidobacteriaceae bacterium]
MPTLLQIDSSPRTDSVSRELTRKYVAEWKKQNPDGTVIVRNVALDPVPFVTEPWIHASHTDAAARTPEQKKALELSDKLVDEFLAADIVVLGVPMWNFGVPAPFKAWIDQITRAGRTFQYTANGPKGLSKATRAIVLSARGGAYAPGSPYSAFDQQEPYIRTILAFLGIPQVEVVHAEQQAMGPENAEAGRKAAREHVAVLTSAVA